MKNIAQSVKQSILSFFTTEEEPAGMKSFLDSFATTFSSTAHVAGAGLIWLGEHVNFITPILAVIILSIQIVVGLYSLRIKKAEYEKICGPREIFNEK